MLARTFKTAVELDITDEQHEALRAVLEHVEHGNTRHVHMRPNFSGLHYSTVVCRKPEQVRQFNMSVWSVLNECGTVGCLAGTACMLTGQPHLFRDVRHGHPLQELFYMNSVVLSYDKEGFPMSNVERQYRIMNEVTLDQARRALTNYLTTGAARWAEVLA